MATTASVQVTAGTGTYIASNSISEDTVTKNLQRIVLNTSAGVEIGIGQQLAAASLPVILPSATITTLTPPAAITGFALETGGNLATLVTNTNKIPSLGQALAASSVPIVLTAAQLITLTPPTSVTVTQTTGTNLHTVLDTTSTTAVTQATAANLNATVVGTGTFVTQSAVTSVAQDASFISQEATTSGIKGITLFGAVTTAKPTYTTLKSDALSLDVNGLLRVSLADTPANTNKFLVTPDSVALPANQSVNMAQVAGTNTVTAGVAGTQAVGGNVATNVAIGTNPINVGAQAISSENTAVTATRMAQLVTDLVGKLIVLPYANPENFVSGRATATDTTSTSLLGAPAAGLRNYVTQITVWNSSATNTYIKIQDGSGGTELYDIPCPATGGATLTLPVPLRQPTTATAIFFAANASANAVFVSASGYKGA